MIKLTMSVAEAQELLDVLGSDLKEFVLDKSIAKIHDQLRDELKKGDPSEPPPSS